MAKGNGKDELVNIGANQTNPYDAKASDFKSPGGKKAGSSEGHNDLLEQGGNQEGPRNAEDDGDMTPSVWGKGGKQFPVGRANEGSTSVAIPETVGLATGKIGGGHKVTKMDEVPDKLVSIG